jgi:DNA-binding response OmpR family regulator
MRMNGLKTSTVILYVEDEISIREDVSSELDKAGFTLLIADDGAAAMEILATQHGAIDMVLTDVNLGRGPTGWNVARRARVRSSSMAVVYASSATESEWMINGVPLSTVIAKPFTSAALVKALQAEMIAAAVAARGMVAAVPQEDKAADLARGRPVLIAMPSPKTRRSSYWLI